MISNLLNENLLNELLMLNKSLSLQWISSARMIVEDSKKEMERDKNRFDLGADLVATIESLNIDFSDHEDDVKLQPCFPY